MQDEDIRKAEKRVMEMNRMTKQLAEQGSRYIQNNGSEHRRSAPSRPETETRFEPVPPQTVRQADITNQNTRQNNSFQRNNAQNRTGGGQVRQNRRSTPPPKAVPPPLPLQESVPKPSALPAEGCGTAEKFPPLWPDSEQLLLIALICLLIREKADFKLIAALGYILL